MVSKVTKIDTFPLLRISLNNVYKGLMIKIIYEKIYGKANFLIHKK